MNTREMLAVICVLVAAPLQALGCSASGQSVVRAMNSKVATYSAGGEFLKDIDGADIAANRAILACDEATSHVKVSLADGSSVWVDRLDVERLSGVARTPGSAAAGGTAGPSRPFASASAICCRCSIWPRRTTTFGCKISSTTR